MRKNIFSDIVQKDKNLIHTRRKGEKVMGIIKKLFNYSEKEVKRIRPLVDKIVRENCDEIFDGSMRLKLVDVLNHKVRIKNSNQYVSNAISIYVKSVIKAIEKKDISYLEFFEYEL